jgi:predicted ATPase
VGVFRRIEAVGYRCLREVNQRLNPFEILVGANGSGKSSFLDVLHFLNDFLRSGLDVAIQRRTPTFQDLVWGRQGTTFRLAVELPIPEEQSGWVTGDGRPAAGIVYTFSARLDEQAGRVEIADESAKFLDEGGEGHLDGTVVRSLTGAHRSGNLSPGFVHDRLRNRSFLQKIPGIDESVPPLAWLRDLLEENIRTIDLDSKTLAAPSPPERGGDIVNTGASLAWQIHQLHKKRPAKLEAWIAHVRTALPDVCTIESVLQQWDNRRLVRIQYENGVQVPSWMLSEGTLRLLALTILAYLPDFHGVYLIEEPENGVHPAALETIYQSLSSVYHAQVLMATHSPVLLSMARPEQILCFSKTREGTTIIRGDEHPALKEWQGEVSLGTMVASGILS